MIFLYFLTVVSGGLTVFLIGFDFGKRSEITKNENIEIAFDRANTRIINMNDIEYNLVRDRSFDIDDNYIDPFTKKFETIN